MNKGFEKKTVLVTGGTRGIGLAIVKEFYNLKAKVIATGTNIKKINQLNKKSKNRIEYLCLDFNSKSSVKNFLANLKSINKIDVLVNNAGINEIDYIYDIDENDWEKVNRINLHGPFQITKEISKIMKNNRSGKIINIASIFGVVSKAMRASYSTTKWGLLGFTKAVALDLAPYNIQVNAVSPGFIDTELTRKILGESGIQEVLKTIPQQRMAKVEEVAEIVVFLASSKNSYITGQNIIIDGGFTSV